ncbi:pantothenate kinase NDAI_0F04600 [Naumovozyma dairenensis CBS 421]|uniref:Pantothenate kinase n=1 Tax=Naumovozyma dairenensis (strain ATCC 10597 / BCRC 20456 / CBS 421 / NBRC 0211 / NRRL Y-12639) TaxID=1071378 RepID=G0WDB7_NAUDC|nr:hypothetical protein NDAI_0F04600 [Naumovozyma dairenensis CBS 421]CCD25778.1 hypothetical protein NDAI_0F04600 [Naumovozyma dairenensis CBS 421]
MQQELEIQYNGCNYDSNLFTIAIDIGGTLAKVIFSPIQSYKLYFNTVETELIEKFIKLLHSIIESYNNNNYSTTRIIATGGGAFKFYDLLNWEFKKIHSIKQKDEMKCLINGLDFFIHEVPNEVFTYNTQDGIQLIKSKSRSSTSSQSSSSLNSSSNTNNEQIYPYLLVNIGSGVSILKVIQPSVFERVGGSSLGGGTLWGLLSLITGAKSYDEMLKLAQDGDNTNVDMLVGDIYGTDYNKIGLKSSNIASSFGKVFQDRSISSNNSSTKKVSQQIIDHNNDALIENNNSNNGKSTSLTTNTTDIIKRNLNKSFQNSDICKSLLYAISNNIGQIAYLQAKIHNVQNIYFGGSYIRGHLTTMNTLSYAINFWSQSSKQAFFLKHEGYLGAMGAFLDPTPI